MFSNLWPEAKVSSPRLEARGLRRNKIFYVYIFGLCYIYIARPLTITLTQRLFFRRFLPSGHGRCLKDTDHSGYMIMLQYINS